MSNCVIYIKLLARVLHMSICGNPWAFWVARVRLPGGQTLFFAWCLICFSVDSLKRQRVWLKATKFNVDSLIFFLFILFLLPRNLCLRFFRVIPLVGDIWVSVFILLICNFYLWFFCKFFIYFQLHHSI